MKEKMIRVMSFVLLLGLLLVAIPAMAGDRALTADLVVVGGGSTGLSAAVAGAQGGASVIVLEKNPYLGGSSNFAEGLFAIESKYQKSQSYGLTKDEVFKHIAEFNHFKINLPLFRQFVNESAANIDWLNQQGIDFQPVQISPTEPITWHLVKDRDRFHHGAALVTALQERAQELGVQFLMRTPAKKITFIDGKAKGVEAVDHKGNRVFVKAKAVVIATGGFGNSKEKIAEWTDFDPEHFKPTLPLNKTGDGIQMSKDVGAESINESLMLHLGTEGKGIIPLGNLYALTWQPNNLWVNKFGERFTDEYVAFSFAQAGNAVAVQPDHFAWAIFDDAYVDYVEKEGIDNGVGVLVPVATKMTSLRKEIAGALAADSESFKAADNIDELARQLGVPVANLKTSYDNYNRYAEHHYDQQFAKEHRFLTPIGKGKLYALKLLPYHFVSLGGIRVNTKMQALNAEFQVIPGLYVGGCDVGGMHGDTYTLWASGNAFGFATYSGRMAAVNALKEMK